MKYCSQCGKELVDEAVVCPNCGCAVQAPVSQQEDKPSSLGASFWACSSLCAPSAARFVTATSA